jgi:hypothetical protein
VLAFIVPVPGQPPAISANFDTMPNFPCNIQNHARLSSCFFHIIHFAKTSFCTHRW